MLTTTGADRIYCARQFRLEIHFAPRDVKGLRLKELPMPGALTPSQVRVLRRVRDGTLWSGECPPEDELGEAMFLAALGLLEYAQLGIFDLTGPGQAYLAEIEQSTPGAEPTSSTRE